MKKIIRNTLISSNRSDLFSIFRKFSWLISLAVITLTSCDDPEVNNFKTPLNNDTFNTKSVDTFSLKIQIEKMESVPSYNFTKDLIGCYYDGITGRTVASAFFNVQLPSATIKLPVVSKINSVTLKIRYAGLTSYFGNLSETQTLRIYEITDSLKSDSAYNSSQIPKHETNAIGSWTGVFKPSDTTLTIQLDTAFGRKILSASKNQLSYNDTFQKFFRGFAVIPDSNVFTGSIVYFFLNNTKTTFSIKYNDTGAVVFPVNSSSVRFSNFRHNYLGSVVHTQLSNPNATYSILPLQPMSGTRLTIKIPYLKHLVDSGIISIHRAEINFPTDQNSPYNASTPASLLLLQKDTANKIISIIDRTENYYDGLLDTSKHVYTFIITRYIQQLLQQYAKNPDYLEKNTLTLIVPSDNPITAAPVILRNTDALGNKVVKLKIWYSKL